MKKFWVSSWKYLIAIPIIAGVIVGIFLAVPYEDEPLKINAEDIEGVVGEKKNIEFNVSNNKAVCEFEIENEDIAVTNGKEILFANVGKTTLTIYAKYGNEIASTEINVNVLPNKDKPEDDNQEPDDNEKPDVDNDKDDNNNSENEAGNNVGNEEDNIERPSDIGYEIYLNNIKVDKIELQTGESYLLRVETDDGEVELSGENVDLIKINGIPNSYKIKIESEGNYNLILKIGTFKEVILISVRG